MVWISVEDTSRVPNKYKSFLTDSCTRPPNKKSSPDWEALRGREWPYRGNGEGDGTVAGGIPGRESSRGGNTIRRADQGNCGRGGVDFEREATPDERDLLKEGGSYSLSVVEVSVL